jgi:hypothetical protein
MSSDSNTRAALAAIGIDLDEVRRRVEELYGPGALPPDRPPRRGPGLEHALALARREARSGRRRRAGPTDLPLAAVLDDGRAATVLRSRDLTPADVRRALAR